jgi:tetratricopeptide (TPR) repeat protein
VLQSTRAYYSLGMMQVGEGAMGSVGTVAGGIADLKKAAVIAERAAQLSPDNIGLRIHISLIDELLGDASFRMVDRQQALAYYQSALAKMNAINTKGDNIRVLSNTIAIKSRMGDVYFANGELEKCVTTYAMVTQEIKKLLDADPSNETLRSEWFADAAQLGYAVALNGHGNEGLAHLRQAIAAADAEPSQTGFVHTQQGVMHDWTGEALELQGKGEEAFHEYETAKSLFEGLRASGANDQRIQIYYAVTLNHFAASLSKSGKPEQAKHEFAESVGILEPLRRANSEDREVRYALADAYTGSGGVAKKLAERESTPSGKLAQWQSAGTCSS